MTDPRRPSAYRSPRARRRSTAAPPPTSATATRARRPSPNGTRSPPSSVPPARERGRVQRVFHRRRARRRGQGQVHGTAAAAHVAARLGGRLLRHRHVGLLRPRHPLRARSAAAARCSSRCTTFGFMLLGSKYVEICWRNPEGGGVVTVATKAFTPRWGCFGGMLITVDYFLTSAISSVSGIHYLASLFRAARARTSSALGVAALVLLALVNIIGIRESASVGAGHGGRARWSSIWSSIGVTWSAHRTAGIGTMIFDHLPLGCDARRRRRSWSASPARGSPSPASRASASSRPAMREPLKRTAGARHVAGGRPRSLVTSPMLTLFSVGAAAGGGQGARRPSASSPSSAACGGGVAGQDRGGDDRVGAAAVRGQHRDHRRLPRLPRARRGRASSRGASPRRNRRFGTPHCAIADRHRRCRCWWCSAPHGDLTHPRRDVRLRPARRVHLSARSASTSCAGATGSAGSRSGSASSPPRWCCVVVVREPGHQAARDLLRRRPHGLRHDDRRRRAAEALLHGLLLPPAVGRAGASPRASIAGGRGDRGRARS